MVTIFETLAPLLLLIVLGASLARWQFLGRAFIADLNKLAFWVALPALLFRSAARAGFPGEPTWMLFGVLTLGTGVVIATAYAAWALLRFPVSSRGTLVQSAFRGNLAYIGIPILTLGLPAIGAPAGAFKNAVVVMTLLMVLYNAAAVVVLQQGNFRLRETVVSILGNPLLVSGLAGLGFACSGLQLPVFADRTLELTGQAAVPIALLCIGGSLVGTRPAGRASEILTAALLKVAFLPAVVAGLGLLAGFDHSEMRIALVLAACPTAAASYVMAERMGGDGELASGSIAASTFLAGPALVIVLWLTGQ